MAEDGTPKTGLVLPSFDATVPIMSRADELKQHIIAMADRGDLTGVTREFLYFLNRSMDADLVEVRRKLPGEADFIFVTKLGETLVLRRPRHRGYATWRLNNQPVADSDVAQELGVPVAYIEGLADAADLLTDDVISRRAYWRKLDVEKKDVARRERALRAALKRVEVPDELGDGWVPVRSLVPKLRGVYACFYRRQVQYVGQAGYIQQRCADHARNRRFSFDDVFALVSDERCLLSLERHWIIRLNPPKNLTHKHDRAEPSTENPSMVATP